MTDLSVQSASQGLRTRNRLRFVTAASLFDGNDVAALIAIAVFGLSP